MTGGNLVILAGGISSRMKKPGTASVSLDPRLKEDADSKSKSMIGVGGDYRPFLDFLLLNASEAGYSDAVVVIGAGDLSIREYYGRKDSGNTFHGLSISYAVQRIPDGRSRPLGTADALMHALRFRPDWRGSSFTVCNSDNLYSTRALSTMLELGNPAGMIDYDRAGLEFEQDRIEQFAVIRKNSEGFLEEIIEKPAPEEIGRFQHSNGRIGVSMNIFRLPYDDILPCLETVPLHPDRHEKELPTAVMMMIRKGHQPVKTFPFSEHVPDLTHKDDIVLVQRYLAQHYAGMSLQG